MRPTVCHPLITIAVLIGQAVPIAAQDAGEDWSGYEGGHLHHNASAVDIEPQRLGVAWRQDFPDPVEVLERRNRPHFHASYNLVTLGPYMAVAGLSAGTEAPRTSPGYITILDLDDGTPVNCIRTLLDGRTSYHTERHYTRYFKNGHDGIPGLSMLHWDPASGILFGKDGGDKSKFTAYQPLANAEGYRPGGYLYGVGAYEYLQDQWPGLARERAQQKATIYFSSPYERLEAFIPLGKGSFGGAMVSMPPEIVCRTRANQAFHFEVDPASPLNTGGGSIVNKWSGLMLGRRGRAFRWGGVLVGNNHLFTMSPAQDHNNAQNGPYADTGPIDQGLRITGRRFTVVDQDGNPLEDPGQSAPRADLAWSETAFEYEFPTAHVPSHLGDVESYIAMKPLHRNQAFLIDGGGVWAAWKPTKTGNAQLIYCDEHGAETWDLGVGAGMTGQAMYPHISLSEVDGRRYITYYVANCVHKEYIGPGFSYKAPGSWSTEPEPPLGPSQLAVFDIDAGEVVWTYDCSANLPGLPINDFFQMRDQSIMVVAGRHAYVGWLNLTGAKATLALAAFDITAEAPEPVIREFPLGFAPVEQDGSWLTSLIADDGRLYALVTHGPEFHNGNHEWEAQHVLALDAADTETNAAE